MIDRLGLWWRVVSLAWDVAGAALAGREAAWSLGERHLIGTLTIRAIALWRGRGLR